MSDIKNKGPGQIPSADVYGTLYPVFNINQTLLAPQITKFKRAISSINPFAHQQIPSQDRMALGPRYGNHFYSPDAYVNGAFFSRMFPGHFDPFANMYQKEPPSHSGVHGPGADLVYGVNYGKLPRGCQRSIYSYDRCLMVNGIEKCQQEQNDIMSICPNWALDELKEKKKFLLKVTAIKNMKYAEAMQVSPYNKGRDVSDVESKTWVHGTRKFLRPDTLWADERYSLITQEEINEAKARVRERESNTEHKANHAHEHEHYDWQHVKLKPKHQPLYP